VEAVKKMSEVVVSTNAMRVKLFSRTDYVWEEWCTAMDNVRETWWALYALAVVL
jgi:hypothetical protein